MIYFVIEALLQRGLPFQSLAKDRRAALSAASKTLHVAAEVYKRLRQFGKALEESELHGRLHDFDKDDVAWLKQLHLGGES